MNILKCGTNQDHSPKDLYFEKGEDTFKEDSICFADSTIFKIFTISILYR